MKKIYLALAILTSALAANAATTERVWLFGNFGLSLPADNSSAPLTAPETYTTAKTTPLDETTWTGTKCTSPCSLGLELCKNYKISAASKPDPNGTYGTFGGRFQLDGFSTAIAPPAIPTTSYLAFNVAGNAAITLYCNPKDAVAKTLNVVNSSGTVLTTASTTATSSSSSTNAEIVTINYTGPATRLTIYPTYALNFNISCLYIYAIRVVDNTSTEVNESTTEVALKKVGEQLQNDEAEEVEVYTVLGAKVLSSSKTAIDISGLASGVYIAKTPTGSMKFIK